MFILAVAAFLTVKNSINLQSIIAESVKSQLISTSIAAREMIDPEAFSHYDNEAVSGQQAYQETLAKLRILAENVGVKYIYALKKQGEQYVFVFDTDLEDPAIFLPYGLSPVHVAAFAGQPSADIMNVDDAYGSFNTGAVPIFYRGEVIGIVCTDIEDEYIEMSRQTALRNSLMLILTLLVTMGVMFYCIRKLLKRIYKMQNRLRRQALYDNITGLPNRQYLMNHLAELTAAPEKIPFALLFVDLDNFKKVNDNAGHDAGDELLRSIAVYLRSALNNTMSFRPSAGRLNIAARVGGDEFVQVVQGVDTAEKAAETAQRLLDGFRASKLSRYIDKFNVGLSIGVALCPHDTENYHVLIKYADIAMYHAKHGGKNQFRIYTDEMVQGKSPDKQ
ncbi:GGDEF domain-containing protein [Desulfovibrio sp. OttesenSCG-928-C06]|nr:GGDEF domain-containing protein [Desulfovibrio sp. OttesenSCG-928-C06]